jgi:two-component system, NarL family, nitrate/nitrite response regulator NarL
MQQIERLKDLPRRHNTDFVHDNIRVALFDDHVLVREQLSAVLGNGYGFDVVATGGTVDDAIACAQSTLPDVIVLDVNMPGDGVEGARKLYQICPFVKIVMLSTQDDAHVVSAALMGGAHAFVAKGLPTRELAAIIQRIHAGQSDVTPELAQRLLAQHGFAAPWRDGNGSDDIELTEREEQVLRRIAQGLTPEETGTGIGLTGTVVASILTNILMKLHEHSLLARVTGHAFASGAS